MKNMYRRNLPSCDRNFIIDFIQLSVTKKSSIWQILDNAARQCMNCSQKLFLARNSSEWSTEYFN